MISIYIYNGVFNFIGTQQINKSLAIIPWVIYQLLPLPYP